MNIKTANNRTPEEEIIFFEKWDEHNLPRIADIFTNQTLPEVYNFAIPYEMQELLARVSSRYFYDTEIAFLLRDYWRERAIGVLGGYRKYRRPILDYDRVTPIAYEEINLLSAKGEKLFFDIQTRSDLPLATLKSATKKDELDLELFIDIDPVIDDFKVSMDYPIINGLKQNINKFACIAGCKNGCSICGEMSQPYIHCMPFPIYLKILSRFKDFPPRTEKKPFFHVVPFDDSDSIFYYDPIIGAGIGDLYRRADKMDILLDCSTRGFEKFGSVAELAVRKQAYSKFSSYANISILFCGKSEELDRNLMMAENLLKVRALYPGEKVLDLGITASSKKNVKDNLHRLEPLVKYSDLISEIVFMRLTPMGRARSAEITDDMQDLPGYLEGAYNKHLEFQLDAYGRIFWKRVYGGVTERRYLPTDIYGRNYEDPDTVRSACQEGATRYVRYSGR